MVTDKNNVMAENPLTNDGALLAQQIETEMIALPLQNTRTMRAVRQSYSRQLKHASPHTLLTLARALVIRPGMRWVAYELLRAHPDAFGCLDAALLEELGQGMKSWDSVDSFARTLSGPAWLSGQVEDDLFAAWAASPDRWWRRAALVSTVALNIRTDGGRGDIPRTLAICRQLAADHDRMVVQALSWALRTLAVVHPAAVEAFLKENEAVLAAQVRREVRNKLQTGLKNPKGNSDARRRSVAQDQHF